MLFVSDHGAALVDELGPRHFCGNLIDLADDEPKVLNELSASSESTDLHAIVPVGIMKCLAPPEPASMKWAALAASADCPDVAGSVGGHMCKVKEAASI